MKRRWWFFETTKPVREDGDNDRTRKRIERIVINLPHTKLFVTASFGVSDSINTKSIDEIINNADKMIYDAKKRGKNRREEKPKTKSKSNTKQRK